MSKNKRNRNRQAVSESILPDEAGESANSETLANGQEKIEQLPQIESGRGRFSTYLKSHLWLVAVICFLALGALGAGLKYLDEDARREIARRNQKTNLNDKHEQTFLNKVNPFLSPPDPTPTPQLSKELMYAGGRLLAVQDANANAAPPADLAIWRPGDGNWWIMSGNGSQQVTQGWGLPNDKPVPGDYDGDGKTDFAVFRPSNGYWYLIYSSNSTTTAFAAGSSTDKLAPADYDGDGKTDIAFWRPSTGVWTIFLNSGSSYYTITFGATGDVPAPADYDGDGKADAAVFRPGSPGSFYYLKSTDLQTITTTSVGTTGDVPVCGDYDGDGKADIAFWTGGGSAGTWKYYPSSGGSSVSVSIGAGTDTPVPNDYDGDGKMDMAVFRGTPTTTPSDAGKWQIRNSSSPSPLRTEQWGAAGDIGVPALWKRQ